MMHLRNSTAVLCSILLFAGISASATEATPPLDISRFASLQDFRQWGQRNAASLETFTIGATEFALVDYGQQGSLILANDVAVFLRLADGGYKMILRTGRIRASVRVESSGNRLELLQWYDGVERPLLTFALAGQAWEAARQGDALSPFLDFGWMERRRTEEDLRTVLQSDMPDVSLRKFSAGGQEYLVAVGAPVFGTSNVRVYYKARPSPDGSWEALMQVGPILGPLTVTETNGEIVISRMQGGVSQTVISIPMRPIYPLTVPEPKK